MSIHFGRIYVVVAGLLILWAAIEFRLFQIQISQHAFYVEQSNVQSAKKINLKARRGRIFDTNGECLATNIVHYDLGADLHLIENKNAVASSFAKAFNRPRSYFLNKLDTPRDFTYLVRKVNDEELQQLAGIDDPGVVKLEGSRRYYPFGKYGSQIIGFTDLDDRGASGIEMQFDPQLKGQDGWTFLLADAHRRFGYDVDYPHFEPNPGLDIELTINKNFQTIVEDELDAGVKKYRGESGMAVLMNPNTGEILAMYSSPGFDPNEPNRSTLDQRRNRAITDIFEPGSTFKIFPAAALLQEKIKSPDSIAFCENGSYLYYKHTINDSKKYGWLSFRRVIENSSNIGMVKLTESLKKKTFYQYLKNFGFDSQTGVDIIGEASGILTKPADFSGLSKAVISFGQEVGVTAVQITNAFAAVVNDGRLMRPYIIKRALDYRGKVVAEKQPQEIRQVITPDVAQTLKSFMLGVVENGTGKKARIDGVQIGGKTGTAQKFDKKLSRYIRNEYMASFIGFAPYDDPQLILSIFIDNPKPSYYGGDVAAPIFAAIIKRILQFAPEKEQPMVTEKERAVLTTTVPNLKGLPVYAAEEYLEFKDLDYEIEGEGSHVISFSNASDEINLILGNPALTTSRMPDLSGLSLREAIMRIDFKRFRVRIYGQGCVRTQSIKAGTMIKNRADLKLVCGD